MVLISDKCSQEVLWIRSHGKFLYPDRANAIGPQFSKEEEWGKVGESSVSSFADCSRFGGEF